MPPRPQRGGALNAAQEHSWLAVLATGKRNALRAATKRALLASSVRAVALHPATVTNATLALQIVELAIGDRGGALVPPTTRAIPATVQRALMGLTAPGLALALPTGLLATPAQTCDVPRGMNGLGRAKVPPTNTRAERSQRQRHRLQ